MTDTRAVRAAKGLLDRLEAGDFLHDSLTRLLADDDEHTGWSIVEDYWQRLAREFTATLTAQQRERYEHLERVVGVRRDYADGYTAMRVLEMIYDREPTKGLRGKNRGQS